MSLSNVDTSKWIILSLCTIAVLLVGSALMQPGIVIAQGNSSEPEPLTIQYLEIVTPNIEEAAAIYSQIYGVNFGEPDPNLGLARTAKLVGGGMIGIREPLSDVEQPIVRPYVLVEDIVTSVSSARMAGSEIALDATEIEGYGQFAIVIQDGIELGVWQLDVAE